MIRREKHVQVAITIKISIGCAPGDHRRGKRRSGGSGHIFEASLPDIAKQQRGLFVSDLRLYPPYLLIDVSVRCEQIEMSIEVIVEEEDPECKR